MPPGKPTYLRLDAVTGEKETLLSTWPARWLDRPRQSEYGTRLCHVSHNLVLAYTDRSAQFFSRLPYVSRFYGDIDSECTPFPGLGEFAKIFCACTVRGRVYVLCGERNALSFIRPTLWIYTIDEDTWTIYEGPLPMMGARGSIGPLPAQPLKQAVQTARHAADALVGVQKGLASLGDPSAQVALSPHVSMCVDTMGELLQSLEGLVRGSTAQTEARDDQTHRIADLQQKLDSAKSGAVTSRQHVVDLEEQLATLSQRLLEVEPERDRLSAELVRERARLQAVSQQCERGREGEGSRSVDASVSPTSPSPDLSAALAEAKEWEARYESMRETNRTAQAELVAAQETCRRLEGDARLAAELRQSLKAAGLQRTRLDTARAEAERKLAEMSTKADRLVSERESMALRATDLEGRAQRADEAHAALSVRYEGLLADHQTSTAEVVALSRQNEQLASRTQTAEARTVELAGRCATLEEDLAKARADLASLQASTVEAAQEAAETAAEVESLRRQAGAAADAATLSEDLLSRLTAAEDTTRSTTVASNRLIAKLRSQIAELERDSTELPGVIERRDYLQQRVDDLTHGSDTEKAALQQSLSEAEAAAAQLEGRVAELSGGLDRETTRAASLQAQLTACQETAASRQATADDLDTRLSECRAALARLKDQYTEQRESAIAWRKECMDMRDAVRGMCREGEDTVLDVVTRLREECACAQTHAAEAEVRATSAEARATQAKALAQQFGASLDTVRGDLAKAQGAADDLRRQLADVAGRERGLQGTIEALREEAGKAVARAERDAAELHGIRARMSSMEGEARQEVAAKEREKLDTSDAAAAVVREAERRLAESLESHRSDERRWGRQRLRLEADLKEALTRLEVVSEKQVRLRDKHRRLKDLLRVSTLRQEEQEEELDRTARELERATLEIQSKAQTSLVNDEYVHRGEKRRVRERDTVTARPPPPLRSSGLDQQPLYHTHLDEELASLIDEERVRLSQSRSHRGGISSRMHVDDLRVIQEMLSSSRGRK
ncbi:hypothetical protein KIPB_001739 [Kipferlia bialata]|uniref:Uncharacterized protein n=1 Tax=Kipferlia bialata TaxID=797122 RepID=A0A9K3CP40_9EUKA|nr:hypothetical protein KIPB_001739 [Kipferlia bialata]|eukprot:g1739.t1